jgi:hypothetical protein
LTPNWMALRDAARSARDQALALDFSVLAG